MIDTQATASGENTTAHHSILRSIDDKSKVGFPLLLTLDEAARRLSISRSHFYRMLAPLQARGLVIVELPARTGGRPCRRVVAESVRRVVERAAERGTMLC